jgi:hypothetical protein
MEIIKKGKIPNETWYGKCSVCKSIFKSSNKELDEITSKEGGDYRSDYEYFYITHCNVCNTSKKSVIFYSKDSKSGLKIFKEVTFNRS